MNFKKTKRYFAVLTTAAFFAGIIPGALFANEEVSQQFPQQEVMIQEYDTTEQQEQGPTEQTVEVTPSISTYEFESDFSERRFIQNEEVPVSVSLKVKDLGTQGYDRVRFTIDIIHTPNGANPQIIATDTNGTEHNVAAIGAWGPAEGFPIPADYEATTEFKVTFDQAGFYAMTFHLVSLDKTNPIATHQATFEVSYDETYYAIIAMEDLTISTINADERSFHPENPYYYRNAMEAYDLYEAVMEMVHALEDGDVKNQLLEEGTDALKHLNDKFVSSVDYLNNIDTITKEDETAVWATYWHHHRIPAEYKAHEEIRDAFDTLRHLMNVLVDIEIADLMEALEVAINAKAMEDLTFPEDNNIIIPFLQKKDEMTRAAAARMTDEQYEAFFGYYRAITEKLLNIFYVRGYAGTESFLSDFEDVVTIFGFKGSELETDIDAEPLMNIFAGISQIPDKDHILEVIHEEAKVTVSDFYQLRDLFEEKLTQELEDIQNAELASLKVDGALLWPSFNKDVLAYTVLVPESTSQVTITANPMINRAIVTGTGIINLEDITDDREIVSVKVQSVDGTTKSYSLEILKVAKTVVETNTPVSVKEAPLFLVVPSHIEAIASFGEPSGNNVISNTHYLEVTLEDTPVVMTLPQGTTITAQGSWNGEILLPRPQTISDEAKPAAVASVNAAFKVGSDVDLTFDKPVRLVFRGLSNQSAGYINNAGEFDQILKPQEVAGLGKVENVDAVNAIMTSLGRDYVAVVDGSDLVIWTKRFSTFLAYEPVPSEQAPETTTPSSNRSRSGGGGGGGFASPSPQDEVKEPEISEVITETIDEEKAIKSPVVSKRFSDLNGHWSEIYVLDLVYKGIISGYPDDTFQPEKTMTRAELAVMIANYKGLSPNESQIFADTNTHWAKGYISAVAKEGIIVGHDETFRPDDTITREQMVTAIVRMLDITVTNDATPFIDAYQISDWAKSYIAAAQKLGIVTGTPEGKIIPKAGAKRAEVATIFYNITK
ncbi:S-layer homology domain-containing protein [Heliorestis convoluta]|uniref:SLH domain-containing protein n=1 Tax=Heliorestis convoluta TaxID=356322 RepID=A0A5Q2MXG2_9FIRM|nr:S-layer homology domain-containing protein [Heliorestis convoluta]QGG47207.1 hypothetical protein FTV88_1055 [Heliorestis convoluta]